MTQLILPGDTKFNFREIERKWEDINRISYRDMAQDNICGGGTTTVAASFATGIKWSSRWIPIALGRGRNFSAMGYFDINMPANGTVIPGHGGASNATVAGGYIPMGVWTALWYELPFGSGSTSLPENFHLTTYTADFQVPDNWVCIARQNGDSGVIQWCDGRVQGVSTSLAPGKTVPDQTIAWRAYRATGIQNMFGSSFINNLLFNATTLDTASIVNTSTSKVVPTKAGYYIAGGTIQPYNLLSGTWISLELRKNGASYSRVSQQGATGYHWPQPGGYDVVYCNGTTDYLQLALVWGSTQSTTLNYGLFSGHFIGA